MIKRLEQVKSDFAKALKALQDAAAEANSDLEIDGMIQRFEFTYELAWKSIRLYLEIEGIVVKTPRESFKEAYRLGLIKTEEEGLRLIDDRNLSVHLYDSKLSRTVAERIRLEHVQTFQKILDGLENRVK